MRPVGSPWHLTLWPITMGDPLQFFKATLTVLGWAAVLLTVLQTPGHALVSLSIRQVLLLLELFKYQRKAPVLNCLVFSHSETSAGLNNSMAPSN